MDMYGIISTVIYGILLAIFSLFTGYSFYRVVVNRVKSDRVTGIIAIILMMVLIYIITLIFRR